MSRDDIAGFLAGFLATCGEDDLELSASKAGGVVTVEVDGLVSTVTVDDVKAAVLLLGVDA